MKFRHSSPAFTHDNKSSQEKRLRENPIVHAVNIDKTEVSTRNSSNTTRFCNKLLYGTLLALLSRETNHSGSRLDIQVYGYTYIQVFIDQKHPSSSRGPESRTSSHYPSQITVDKYLYLSEKQVDLSAQSTEHVQVTGMSCQQIFKSQSFINILSTECCQLRISCSSLSYGLLLSVIIGGGSDEPLLTFQFFSSFFIFSFIWMNQSFYIYNVFTMYIVCFQTFLTPARPLYKFI